MWKVLTLLFYILMQGSKYVFFVLRVIFWCWHKSHCSSPIATKGFGSAVSLLFWPTFAWSFPNFRCKEFPDLQKNQPFPFYFMQYFSLKIPSCIVIMFPIIPLSSKAEQGWHFYKANTPRAIISSATIYLENWKLKLYH